MNHTEFVQRLTEVFEKPTFPTRLLSLVIGEFIASNKLWHQVEARTGISRRSLQRSFNGKSKPDFDTIAQVLGVLGVDFRPVAVEIVVNLNANPEPTTPVQDPPATTVTATGLAPRHACVNPINPELFRDDSVIVARCVQIISEELGVHHNEIKPESTIYDLGADSLDMVELVMRMEDDFEIEIPDAEVEVQEITMAHLIDVVLNYTKPGASI